MSIGARVVVAERRLELAARRLRDLARRSKTRRLLRCAPIVAPLQTIVSVASPPLHLTT
jgi:hypothetical protein